MLSAIAGSATRRTSTIRRIGPALLLCAAGALGGRAQASTAGHESVPCQRLRGHTIVHRGPVRVYRASGTVFGCLEGRAMAWQLWEAPHGLYQGETGSVRQIEGHFLAYSRHSGNQYGFTESDDVVNLTSGASYTIDLESEQGGVTSASPATPGPRPLVAFRLGQRGRTLRLYDTYAPSATTNLGATPTGETLDVIGFGGYHRALATSPPGTIGGASLSFRGDTVSWRQRGRRHAVRL